MTSDLLCNGPKYQTILLDSRRYVLSLWIPYLMLRDTGNFYNTINAMENAKE